jgi:DNA processing protein
VSGFAAADRLARLRLIRTDGVGPVGFARLLERHGDAARALDALGGAGRPVGGEAAAEAEFTRAAALGVRHVFLGEPSYPPLLAELADPPPVLLVAGNTDLAARPTVAMVGARNASAAGLRLAEEMAAGLAEAGFVVVSGLARGIDGAAHMGALAAGATIACVAGGPDIAYPPEHAGLQQEIAARGLLVSEMPCGVEPQARHFPRRNRLIAGIARALVVVEAALGSGSLITARLATEAGRDVMAVPGHPRDPRARGPNGLIKEGAALVEDAADVLAMLDPFRLPGVAPRQTRVREEPGAFPDEPEGAGETADPAVLLGLLSATPVAIDELVRRSGLPAGDVQAFLVGMEIDGRLVRHAGGRVALADGGGGF